MTVISSNTRGIKKLVEAEAKAKQKTAKAHLKSLLGPLPPGGDPAGTLSKSDKAKLKTLLKSSSKKAIKFIRKIQARLDQKYGNLAKLLGKGLLDRDKMIARLESMMILVWSLGCLAEALDLQEQWEDEAKKLGEMISLLESMGL